MKYKLLFLIVLVFMGINGVKAKDYDCNYQQVSGNSSVTLGYDIGGELTIVKHSQHTKLKDFKITKNEETSKYGTDKCYKYVNLIVKTYGKQQYLYYYKIGDTKSDVDLDDKPGTAKAILTQKVEDKQQSSSNTTTPQKDLDITPINICDSSDENNVLLVFQVIGYCIIIIKILVPLILIIMGSIDLGNAAISSDDAALKTAVIKFGKRIIIGVIVFFVPTILDFFLSKVSGVNETMNKYTPCTKCLLNPNSSECNPKKLTD